MPVGQGELLGYESYLAVGRQTAFATGNTATESLDFVSASFKESKEGKIIEEVTRQRTYAKRTPTGKVIEGEVEFYPYVESASFVYLMQNALGGTLTSATATGETLGGNAFEHDIRIGAIQDQSYPALHFNHRKGGSTSGKVFEYIGGRVNELTINSEIDEALKCSASLMFKDATFSGNNVSAALTQAADCHPLSFVDGRVSIENSFASLTSSSYWHVQSVEWGISNNLKSDSESRRIGSDTLDVMPAGIANLNLKLTLRFDTSTARDNMLNATNLACELNWQGPTLSSASTIRRGLKLQLPAIQVSDSGDPEIGGPDELLTQEVVFHVLRDISSASGYALRALITNTTSSYA